MSAYRSNRALERQREATTRQGNYDLYVNDLLLGSSEDVARASFRRLSPAQQRRVLNDPAFDHLTWLEYFRDPTNALHEDLDTREVRRLALGELP